jgi:hypothetical protein
VLNPAHPYKISCMGEGKMRRTGSYKWHIKASSENLSHRIFGRGFFFIDVNFKPNF